MFKKLFAVCLLVNDFDTSFDFYKTKLGLELKSKDNGFANFKLEGPELAIFQKDAATAMFPKKYMGNGGGVSLAFQADNLQLICKKLTNAGVDIFEGPKQTPWGQKVAYFKDPGNNIWEVSEPFEE
jgi:catechol 2,3-dioxygenase-like lactoylglutathione lyase family enzyme